MEAQSQTEPMIGLTTAAAAQIKAMIADNPENQGKTLRVYVENGGCSGLQYGLVFDEPRDKDRLNQLHGVTVLVDEFSASYLQGSVVDFSDSLNSGGFKIINPNAKQSCGCGRSFEAGAESGAS